MKAISSGAENHQADRQHQCLLAAFAVRVRAEQQPAERPDQIGHAEHGVGLHQLDARVAAGEEVRPMYDAISAYRARSKNSRALPMVAAAMARPDLGGHSGFVGAVTSGVRGTERSCRVSGGVQERGRWRDRAGCVVERPVRHRRGRGTGRPPGPGLRGRSTPTGVRRGRVDGMPG